jgi:cytochrome c biogenesis protein
MKQNIFKQIWRWLARLEVAAILIVIVLLLTALGSCFPQLAAEVAGDAERLARWQAGVQARYGPLTGLLTTGGLFRWFDSPVLLIGLALLFLATLVCTLNRWRAVWRRARHPPQLGSDLVVETAPHTASLTGPSPPALPHLVRDWLVGRGFQVQSATSGGVVHLRGDRNRPASLGTLVTHLALLLLLLGTLLSQHYGWQDTLTLGPGEIVEVGHGRSLALRNDGFTIVRYPAGRAMDYRAAVTILDGGRAVAHRLLRVNGPLTYRQLGFYLQGYGGSAGRYSLSLLVRCDPGYGLVVTAGFLLLLGLTVSFNFPRSWIQVRVEPEGALHLAGWAGRHATDFEAEFATLLTRLQGALKVEEAGA